jgi:hypothetical protein
MKLTKTKVRFILRQNRKEMVTKEIARDLKVSQRRVQQVIKEYKETGREPIYGEKSGAHLSPTMSGKRRSSRRPMNDIGLERGCWSMLSGSNIWLAYHIIAYTCT